ncbi:DUF229 domain containing [Brachionus plicatilis]|uniref:DUF229 domain containing n=1 Tax=Brachionus plicatilis TaxID=10195 RepID=A0A3M7S6F8_BRAPC|nr:DUF229 domain containing [Brachionus plicatilis]
MNHFLEANQTTQQRFYCKLPNLTLNRHDLTAKYTPCKLKEEWGFLKYGRWYFNKTVVDKFSNIKCTYRSIIHVSDSKFEYSMKRPLSEGTLISDEQIQVDCVANIFYYKNIHVQILNKMNVIKPDLSIQNNFTCKPLNVLLLSYDSISRVSWFKRLPKTTKYLTETLDATILNGHTIVGDGSFNNLTPLYTGKYSDELPSASKYDPNGSYVDEVFPFLWKDLHKKGFASFHYEDIPYMSTFTFRHRGFLNNHAHHYMKAFTLAVQESKLSKDDLCIGNTKRSKKALDLVTEFIEMYKDKSNFIAFMHNDENSHGNNLMVNQLDDDLERFLKQNFKNSNLDNTALFLFSDHGVRYGNDRMTHQGDLEERLPMFSIYLPKAYKNLNMEKIDNLKKNANQLTTAFDVYKTIRELTCLDGYENRERQLRSISVLDTIPINRSCIDIGMRLHFCTCLQDWIDLNTDESLSFKVVNDVVKEMNNAIENVKEYCAKIELKSLNSIKYTYYLDKKVYRLVFVTKPTDGFYEATISYEKNGSYSIDPISSISRINIYGSHSYCVNKISTKFNLIKDIRKLCHCL